jgi:hypothetical protein
MGGELTRLSETRWRFATARRVYYLKQAKGPNEDTGEPGTYWVDGGSEGVHAVTAGSVEQVTSALAQGLCPTPNQPSPC